MTRTSTDRSYLDPFQSTREDTARLEAEVLDTYFADVGLYGRGAMPGRIDVRIFGPGLIRRSSRGSGISSQAPKEVGK